MIFLKVLGIIIAAVLAAVAFVLFGPPSSAAVFVVVILILLWYSGKREQEKEKAFQGLKERVGRLENVTAYTTSELSDRIEELRKRVLALEATVYLS